MFEQGKRQKFEQSRLFIIFLIGIFLKDLSFIPNMLKWQDCKIFKKLVLS